MLRKAASRAYSLVHFISFDRIKNKYTSGQESESEANTTERRDIDSLTTDNTGSTNTGGVFTRTRVGDSISKDLDGVLVGHEVDDIESLFDDLHGVQLLTSVAAVEHQAVSKTFDKRTLHITDFLKHLLDPCGIS